jgi:hypothetical protein
MQRIKVPGSLEAAMRHGTQPLGCRASTGSSSRKDQLRTRSSGFMGTSSTLLSSAGTCMIMALLEGLLQTSGCWQSVLVGQMLASIVGKIFIIDLYIPKDDPEVPDG